MSLSTSERSWGGAAVIADCPTNRRRIEVARPMTGRSERENRRPYDRRDDDINVGEVVRIGSKKQPYVPSLSERSTLMPIDSAWESASQLAWDGRAR